MSNSTPKKNLEEGKYYPFKVSGSVVLPDGTECFILTDINRVKHLLNKEYYHSYHLDHNQEIRCRIDKINCTGKIFIEPEHPHYKLGAAYTFEFDHYEDLETRYGGPEKLAVLKNGYAEDIYLPAEEIERTVKKGDRIQAVVERIKKGRVYITLERSINDYTGLEGGKRYRLLLSGTVNEGGRYAYYLLKEDSGREFRIRKKFYGKYGFEEGDLITCELVETDHQVYLEPIHPLYDVGFDYDFKIIGETLVNIYPDGQVEAYLLENKYGKSPIIKKSEVLPGNIHSNMIRCTVTAIKKSQVFLACK